MRTANATPSAPPISTTTSTTSPAPTSRPRTTGHGPAAFALAALRKLAWETVTEARKHVVGTIKEVSKILRNTPAVCRKCYVHPAVIEAFEAGELADELPPSRRSGLKADRSEE